MANLKAPQKVALNHLGLRVDPLIAEMTMGVES
jgi:hypothetical protein